MLPVTRVTVCDNLAGSQLIVASDMGNRISRKLKVGADFLGIEHQVNQIRILESFSFSKFSEKYSYILFQAKI